MFEFCQRFFCEFFYLNLTFHPKKISIILTIKSSNHSTIIFFQTAGSQTDPCKMQQGFKCVGFFIEEEEGIYFQEDDFKKLNGIGGLMSGSRF
jgi:hypothetical protein